jgi:two-component system response regulator RegX3
VRVHAGIVELPLKEFELLELLLANAGRVLTRETLIDRVWGPHYVGDTKTLDVHIKRLRSKIEDQPSSPRRIVTIRGLGYKYAV